MHYTVYARYLAGKLPLALVPCTVNYMVVSSFVAVIGDDAILIVNCTTEEIQVSWRGINNCLNSDYHCRLSLNYTFGSEVNSYTKPHESW